MATHPMARPFTLRSMGRLGLLAVMFALGTALQAQTGSDLFQRALSKERVEGDVAAAIVLYERVVREFAADRALTARALVQIGRCYERLGRREAQNSYQRVVGEYAEQTSAVAEARARLAALDRTAASGGEGMTASRVWSGTEVVVEGVPSGDGRYLSALDVATGDLAIRDLASGRMRRLFAKPKGAEGPEFAEASIPSPDGTRIVYQWFTADNTYELRTIGLTDAQPRVLFRDPDNYSTPAGWSGDGKHVLAVIGRNRASQIAWIAIADGSVRVLKTLDWRWPSGIRVSPNGRFIVYDFPADDRQPQRDIFLLHGDGSRETRLVEHAAHDRLPIWTPDGKGVLFTSDRSGVNSLWMIRVDEGRPRGAAVLVKPDVGQSVPLGFTRNGAYYYGAFIGGVDVYLATLDRDRGTLSSPPARLTERFVGSNSAADWSPDGTSVVFITQRGPAFGRSVDAGHLVVRSVETGEQRDLATALGRFYGMRWTADGRSITAAATDPQGIGGWYRIDVATGGYERIRFAEHAETSIDELEWSPDGQTMFYRARDAAGTRLMRQTRDSATPHEIYRAPAAASAAGLTISPDGKQVAFRTTDLGSRQDLLLVMPSAGGDPREIVRLDRDESIPASSLASPIAWLPTADALLFVKRGKRGAATNAGELWRVSLTTRQVSPVGLSMPGLRQIRVRPGGGTVALAAGEGRAEVWVMHNFLPSTTAAPAGSGSQKHR